MTKPRNHGNTKAGVPITDELIERLADDAEKGFGVDALVVRRGKRDRPTLGTGPSTVESVRLDAELREQLARRAEQEGVSVAELIREALRGYLEAS